MVLNGKRGNSIRLIMVILAALGLLGITVGAWTAVKCDIARHETRLATAEATVDRMDKELTETRLALASIDGHLQAIDGKLESIEGKIHR